MLAASVALALLAALAGTAQAIGVIPGRATMDFEPGLEKAVTFTITNNEHKQFNAYVYAEGDLKDSIILGSSIVAFNESDNSKPFTYTVKLPERLDPPGDHWAKIVVMELPPGPEAPEGETSIIATVAVIHQLRVKVPYPGKLLQLDMSVQEAVPNESVRFFVKLFNLGKEDIASAEGTLEVLGPTNEVIASLGLGQAPVKSMEKAELVGEWRAAVNPGMYHAVATVRYDGEVGKAEKNFYVGNMLVDITDVSVKDFSLGGIAKFDIAAESRWNQRIDGVYASLLISNGRGDKVADIKSASIDMTEFEKAHLYAYWDTEGINEGDYLTALKLYYGGKVTEREINMKVGLNSIRTDIVGVSAGAITGQGDVLQQYPVIILVAVLVAINFAWFLYFRKRR